MPDINVVGGRLGGVGKSTFSCCLIHIHQMLKIPYLAIDADPQTYNVHHFYPDTYKLKFSEEDFDNADIVWETASEQGKNIILNLAASSSEAVHQWLVQNNLLQLAADSVNANQPSERVRFVEWFLCDAGEFSVAQFIESVNTYGNQMTHVLVRNQGKSKPSAWERLEANSELQEVLKRPYVKQMDFPKFLKPTGYDAMQLTFAQAIDPEAQKLKLLDRQRVVTFLRGTQDSVERLELLRADITPVETGASNGKSSKGFSKGKEGKDSEVSPVS